MLKYFYNYFCHIIFPVLLRYLKPVTLKLLWLVFIREFVSTVCAVIDIKVKHIANVYNIYISRSNS